MFILNLYLGDIEIEDYQMLDPFYLKKNVFSIKISQMTGQNKVCFLEDSILRERRREKKGNREKFVPNPFLAHHIH